MVLQNGDFSIVDVTSFISSLNCAQKFTEGELPNSGFFPRIKNNLFLQVTTLSPSYYGSDVLLRAGTLCLQNIEIQFLFIQGKGLGATATALPIAILLLYSLQCSFCYQNVYFQMEIG